MSTLTHSARGALAVVAVAALALTGAVPAVAVGTNTALDASDVPTGDYVAVTETGTDFTIWAAAGKNVTVDGSNRVSDRGEEFTQRIKLNGTGAQANRSLHFTVAADQVPTEVHVNARSGNSTADRAVALYNAAGEVGRVTAAADLDSRAVETGSIPITAPGDYWLASPSSGVNVYYAQLGAFDDVPRADWANVAAPVITSVSPDAAVPGDLVVSYDGVLGADGGDVVYATLFDAAGAAVDQTLAAADGPGGTLTLTPPASGAYEVEVRLTRAGEAAPLTSARVAVPDFSLPLAGPSIIGALTSAVSAAGATVTLTWSEVAEAESYSIEASQGGAPFTEVVEDVVGGTADVAGLTPGATYQMRVVAHRGDDRAVGAPTDVEVAGAVERWQIADVGSNAGSGGSVTENEDGSIVFDAKASSTKIATSEDGFQYYFTEIDPETENFTLSATFEVTDASTADTQSGFGIIAVDDVVAGSSPHRYFNSAGAVVSRCLYGSGSGEWHNGTPCARFVTGYTGPTDVASPDRDELGSEVFDMDWRPEITTAKFQTGDVYDFTLRKSNTGFHAIWTRDGDVVEVIEYEPDLLLQQNPEAFYVGMAVARKIVVTVTDWEFTTIHPADDEAALPRPTEYVPARLDVSVTSTTPETRLDIPLAANMYGTGQILDAAGTVVAETPVAPGEVPEVPVDLQPGVNELTARLLVAEDQPQLEEYEQPDVTSVDVPLAITVDSYGQPGQSIWVAPDGTADGDGTKASPLDLHTAVAYAQAGQQIVLRGGTYLPQRAIVAGRGRDGAEGEPITIMSEPGTRALLDLSQSPDGGLIIRGDWWHVYNLEITNSADKKKPMLVQGHHNIVERVESHHNRDTGIQISGSEAEPPALWPTDNLVVSSISHNNADVGGNDADGFAAKLSVGEGNVFRSNIAYNNIDDGWDLYAKSTSGPIGTVIVEDSVAYDNGWLEADPSVTGEGNGFKLGGESIPGDHLLRNSISYGNLATGVTSNSGPDVRLDRVTSVFNDRGVRLETNAATTAYEAAGVLSWQNPSLDVIGLKQDDQSLLTDPSNVWNLGTPSPVTSEWFASIDVDGIRPTIAADGSVDMHGLLELTDAAPADTGARLSGSGIPTDIPVLPEVTVPLENLSAPVITGEPERGERLTVDAGTWSHADATFTYRWLRDGKAIRGATGDTYRLSILDAGRSISVEVTATVDGQPAVTVASDPVRVERLRLPGIIGLLLGWIFSIIR